VVDVLEYLNYLNVILQGEDLLVHELYTAVEAFKTNLFCSENNLMELNVHIFMLCKEFV